MPLRPVWGGTLQFSFSFLWWLVMLSIFSHAYLPFVWKKLPSDMSYYSVLSQKWVLNCVKYLFGIYQDNRIFLFNNINILSCINRVPGIESLLYFWNTYHLVTVHSCLHELLDSIYHYFIWYFCIESHMWVVSFSCHICPGLVSISSLLHVLPA